MRGNLRRASLIGAVLIIAGAGQVIAQTITYSTFTTQVGSGLQTGQLTAQLSDSQHGGITVHIASVDTFLALVADGAQTPGTESIDVFVPNGSTVARFFVQALEDTLGMVSITASAPGFGSVTDSTEVVQPGMRLNGLSGSSDVSANDDNFRVQVGIPTSTHSNLQVFQAARAGGPGLTATVSHTNPAAAQLVTTALTAQVVTVIVLPGQTASGGTVTVGGVALDGIGSGVTEVTASIPGFVATTLDTQTVTVTQSFITYTGTPFEVGSGLQAAQKAVKLSGGQHGGVTVHVESSDSNLALVSPGSNTPGSPSIDFVLPNGATQVAFFISALEDTSGVATITATTPGFIPVVDTVNVATPAFRIHALAASIDTFDPPDAFLVEIGLPKLDLTTLKITQVVRAGGFPLSVGLTSSDSLVGNFALQNDTLGMVSIPIGVGNSSTGSVFFGGAAFNGLSVGTTQVQASIPGFVSTAAGSLDVAVTQPGITMTNMPANGVGSGLQVPNARAVLGASAHGGVFVRIKSNHPDLMLVAVHADSAAADSVEIFLPNNQTQVSFHIHALEDTTGTATITASAPGFGDGSTPVDNVQPGVRIVSGDLGSTLDTIDPPDPFRVQVGVPINSNSTVFAQIVRTGGQPIVVTMALDDSLRATLQTLADTSDTVSVVVDNGESTSPTTVALGGVALDGLALGPVTVSASAAGFLSVTDAQKVVTITAPTIAVTGLFSAIGAGLQSGELTAQLSASNHGGVTLHVETSDTNVALVSDGETVAGTEFIDIFVPDGQAQPKFYIQGADNITGSATVTLSAPQFVGTDAFPSVVQPAVDIVNLSTTIDVGDPADEFVVRVGVPNGGNTTVSLPQLRRGGAPPLVATAASNDTSVALVETMLLSGDSVVVEIAAGQSVSPTDIASGGVGLKPVAEGQMIVFASIPNFIQTGGAQRTVDITNKTIVFLGLPALLGAGLETNVVTAQLGSSNHGGLAVHVEVDDSTKAIVSLNALVVGDLFVDVFVPNGQTDAPFYLQAFEGVADTVTVTVSAAGFTTNARDVEIVPPALQMSSLADSFTVVSSDDEFVVQIGALMAGGAGILETQLVRPGGTPVDIKVTSSDAGVGTIETQATSADSAVVTIGIGEGQTPETVLTGGMAFHPAGTGTALVEATALGFFTTEAGSSTVWVLGTATGINDGDTPPRLSLDQNFPNPFNPTTTIRFVLPVRVHTELAVFDVRGRRVVTLLNRSVPGGVLTVTWDGRDQHGNAVSSGVYFYRLIAGTDVETRKMVLLK